MGLDFLKLFPLKAQITMIPVIRVFAGYPSGPIKY